MIITFSVPGEPQGKGRGRAVRFGASVRVVTPKQTRSYEATVAACAQAAARYGVEFPVAGPMSVEIVCVHRRPGAMFARTVSGERIPRPRKPDVDNVVKAVLDGISAAGVWQDDGQVCRLVVTQVDGAIVDRKGKTSEPPHVMVIVSAWTDGGER